MKEIMLPYILICIVLVKAGVVQWTLRNASIMVGTGLFLAFMLFTAHRFWSPADLTDSTTVKAPHAVLSPLIGQEVEHVYVTHNQHVKEGELIYTLKDVDTDSQIRGLEAERTAAEAEILAFHHQIGNDKKQLETILTNAKPPVKDDVVLVYAAVEGWQGEKVFRNEYYRAFNPIEIDGQMWRAISWTTAASIAAVVEMVANGSLPDKGFIKQEEIPFDKFLETENGKYFL